MNVAGAAGGALAGPILTLIAFQGLAGVLLVLVLAVVITQLRTMRGDWTRIAPHDR